MDLQSLLDRRKEKESHFNELAKKRSDIDEELFKLQGEYRALTDLITDLEAKKTKKEK